MPQEVAYALLNDTFSLISYKKLVSGLVDHEFYDQAKDIAYESETIQKVENIGSFQGDRFHNILVIKHRSSIAARVKLATETFKLMTINNIDAALIAYYSEDTDLWRLSLVTLSFEENKSGGISKRFSNPRRYSFILGPTARIVTPYKYLISKGRAKDFEDLTSRFSIEVVNNEFYREIAKLYDELVGTDKVQGSMKYPEEGERKYQFAVRLIGRIVFCWFLKEKHSDNGIPLVSSSLLSKKALDENNYYNKTLAPLFFETLNLPISKRYDRFKEADFKNVPYLNGGLFAAQEDDYYKFDEHLSLAVSDEVSIPDKWLQKLFELLELYHFTVDENTSVDVDLSIDPEMLGRIFENLLARINPETGETVRKATGSFYTPREVVEYMVDNTLVEYLYTSTGIGKDQLKALVSYSLEDDKEFPLNDTQKRKAVSALSSMKILDPACGSGAYPIGAMQKIVFILQQIDPEAKVWFENQIANTIPEVRHLIEREFQHKNFDYIRKLGVIRESIFGVDIQPIATEIARLRCFLTLIVDERVNDDEPNRGVYPLPNLDFKFVTANTLIKLGTVSTADSFSQGSLFEDQSGISELKQLRDDYFNSHNLEKETLKTKFYQAQKNMFLKLYNTNSKGLAETTHKLSAWDPFMNQPTDWFDAEWMFGINGGFDVVIGNPPYYIENDDRARFDGLRSLDCYQGKMNVWYLFGGFGIDSLKNNGILCYIATNNWTTNAGASKWRNKIMSEAKILGLLDFGSYMVFESASQQTMVMMFAKNLDDRYRFDYRRINAQKPVKKDFQDLLRYSPNSNNEFLTPVINRQDFKNKLLTFSNDKYEAILNKMKTIGTAYLNDKEVANGIHPHYDYVNKKIATKLGGSHKVGDGIFALSNNELKSLNLTEEELTLIKPYYTTSELSRYHAEPSNREWIIYTDSSYKDPSSMDTLPSLKRHLDQFNSIITSANHPYGLHRAREEKFFKGEKIISLRKSPGRPSFTFVDFDCYVSATFYVIKTNRINSRYLTGLLNSKLITFWLKNKGKMQGQNYQIDKEPLVSIPIVVPDDDKQSVIADLVSKIYSDNNLMEIEPLIDHLIYEIYGLNEEEIAIVENSLT